MSAMSDEDQKLRDEVLRHVTQSTERWGEQWRRNEATEDRLKDVEGQVTTIAREQASTKAEMRAEVRWSSFFGTILAGAVVGGVLLIVRLIVGQP